MLRPRNLVAASAIALALLGGSSASAAPVFFDDFSQERLELNAPLDNWTVSGGTVDVIGTGFHDYCGDGGPSPDRCVDLDGSTGNAARIESVGPALAAGDYEFSFWARGNKRNLTNDTVVLEVETGVLLPQSITLNGTDGWKKYIYSFSLVAPQTVALVFDHAGGDNIGILIDNVEVNRVPEPASLSLALLAFGSAVAARRRR
jgi:hypothetical protein